MSKDYSQNGESKILWDLCQEIGIQKPVCLDIGAWDGYHFSNTRYFKDRGCDVIMFDGDNRGNDEVNELFITLDNVDHTLDREYDLLCYDTDGNDYWIISEILKHQKPSVLCFEVNSQLPLDECITIPYNAEHFWDGSYFYGMSYLAACKLCKDNGYYIYDVINNTNIIAIRNDYKIKPKLYSFGLTWSHPENNKQFIKL